MCKVLIDMGILMMVFSFEETGPTQMQKKFNLPEPYLTWGARSLLQLFSRISGRRSIAMGYLNYPSRAMGGILFQKGGRFAILEFGFLIMSQDRAGR